MLIALIAAFLDIVFYSIFSIFKDEKEKRALDIRAGCTYEGSTQIYLSAITLPYSFIYLCAACGTQIRTVVTGCRKPNLDKTEIQIRSVGRYHVKPRPKFHWNSNVSGKQYGARCWNAKGDGEEGRGIICLARSRECVFKVLRERNSLQNIINLKEHKNQQKIG